VQLIAKGRDDRIAIIGVAAVAGSSCFAFAFIGNFHKGESLRKDFVESIGTGVESGSPSRACRKSSLTKHIEHLKSFQRVATESFYYWIVNWIPRALWANKPDIRLCTQGLTGVLRTCLCAWSLDTKLFTFIGQGYYRRE